MGITPGTRDKSKSIRLRPYLELLADELGGLAVHGIEVYDAHIDRTILVKVYLLSVGGDYRGIEEVLGITGAPHADHACYRCWGEADQGPHKKLYGRAYVHLDPADPLRDRTYKLHRVTTPRESRDALPPAPRTHEQLMAKLRTPPVPPVEGEEEEEVCNKTSLRSIKNIRRLFSFHRV